MTQSTLSPAGLDGLEATARVKALRAEYFRARPQICAERAKLVTEAHAVAGLFDRDWLKTPLTPRDKAEVYARVLATRQAIVHHERAIGADGQPFPTSPQRSLFAGSTTSRYKGVLIYPELLGLALWPELWSMHRRPHNPYHLTDEDRRTLNDEVFPRWVDRTVLELTRRGCYPDEVQAPGYTPTGLLQYLSLYATAAPNCVSHTIPCFQRAVYEGLARVRADAHERSQRAADERARDFYAAVETVLWGVIQYSRNLAQSARALAAQEKDPSRRRELEDLAAIHARVPEQAATTFREGLTTVWVCWTALHQENANAALSLGRLDQLLWPLYAADLAAGRTTPEQAVELVACLWLKIGDHVPAVPKGGEDLFGGTGSNQAITLGGVDREGKDAVNELSCVMLRATEQLGLRDPNVNARYHPDVSSPAWLRRICRANVRTRATPALHNDRAVVAVLEERNTPKPADAADAAADARDYGIVGCVEPVSVGRSYTFSGAIQINLATVLELTLFRGRHRSLGGGRVVSLETEDPGKLATFAQFQDEFRKQLAWMAEITTTLNDQLEAVNAQAYPVPLLSALFEGPLERGRDLTCGSARYNAAGVTVIGLADVADALSAIEEHVFRTRQVPWTTLEPALRANWKDGFEPVRALLANPGKTPKYGRDEPWPPRSGDQGRPGEANARWLLAELDAAFRGRTTYRGGFYRVGYWTMTNHAGYGRLTHATPEGRRARASFASGITPASSAARGLAETIAATASLPVAHVSNGMALNLKFPSFPDDGSAASEAQLDSLVSRVLAYFDPRPDNALGGMEVQFNLHDQKILQNIAAGALPTSAADELLVRVSGYTAYFKDLNEQMKQEIIDRTMYDLATGEVVAGLRFELPGGQP